MKCCEILITKVNMIVKKSIVFWTFLYSFVILRT